MRKRYYNDPLAAAWMAKHFGMRFTVDKDNEHPYFSGGFIGIMMSDGNRTLGSRPHHPDELLYIHPDSLHLLDHNAGDVCECMIIDSKGSYNDMIFRPFVFEQIPDKSFNRIIQRNGIAFMWPEKEC